MGINLLFALAFSLEKGKQVYFEHAITTAEKKEIAKKETTSVTTTRIHELYK